MFTKFHASKHLGTRVTQTCMFTLFFVVVRKGYCKLSECWYRIINLYMFARFHTSKHLGKRVICMFTLCFVVVRKGVLFTNKLPECWCRIINPYVFTKFHTSKHFGKRVTQHACSHYSLLWCENGIVYQHVIRTLVSYH